MRISGQSENHLIVTGFKRTVEILIKTMKESKSDEIKNLAEGSKIKPEGVDNLVLDISSKDLNTEEILQILIMDTNVLKDLLL